MKTSDVDEDLVVAAKVAVYETAALLRRRWLCKRRRRC
jgi:hypothetical protein